MERPDRQDAHEILLVLDGPAEVGGRLSSVGGQPGGFLDRLVVEALAPQRAFRLPGFDRRQPHVGEPDADPRAEVVGGEGDLNGDRGRGDSPSSSDGVVPYWSSHMNGAKTENIVPSNHSAHQNPQAIDDVMQILKRYAK